MKSLRRLHRLALAAWLLGVGSPFVIQVAAEAAPTPPPTTQPATAVETAYREGLVAEIYVLQTRPKRLRQVLPGLPAKAVRVAAGPEIRGREALEGHTGNVQVEFEGEIYFPESGEYKLAADADDGMDLSLAGQILLSNVWINGANRPSEAAVTLQAGWHPIRVRFYQGDGGFGLRLRRQGPGEAALAAVPPSHFRVSEARIAAARVKLSVNVEEERSNPAHAHRSVFRTRGFYELPENDGDLLVEVLEGPTVLSTAARKDFAATLEQTNYAKLPYWHQVKVLSGFLRGWFSGQVDRGGVTRRGAYTLSDPVATEYDGWRGAKRKGFRTVVMLGQHEVTVYTPAADSPERENVAKGVASLPKALRVLLKTVRVEPYGTANEFNGGGDEIWVRRGEPTPAGMIENTFAHEIGHLLMNRTDCYLAWEQAIAKDTLSISHYGRLNPSEDFAEFVRLYLSTEGDAAKLASLGRMFGNRVAVLDRALKEVGFAWEF